MRKMIDHDNLQEFVKDCVYGMIFSQKKSSHTHNLLQTPLTLDKRKAPPIINRKSLCLLIMGVL